MRSDLLKRRWVATAVAGALYLGYAIAITWPFALHPRSSIFGVVGYDLTGSISRFQEFIDNDQLPFLPGRIETANAPDGLATTWALDLAAFPNISVHWGLSVLAGAIAANGLLTIAAFTLCALSMFLFARWLTGHAGVALIAGVAFGFWPWVFSTSSQALGHGWVFVLLVWSALLTLERPTLRNGVILGLATALCMTWFPYWILIGGIFYATLAGVSLLVATARNELRLQLRSQLAAFGVILLLTVCLGVLRSAASAGEVPVRPESEAYIYSARPLMYLLPHPQNPIFGGWSSSIIEDRFDDFTPESPAYANIYLGWTMLILALVGFGWLIQRLRRDGRQALRERMVAAGLAASVSAVVALLFSAPPRVSVLGISVPMPEELILQATTAFRVTHRFALVVMVGVCILAALGLRAVLVGRSATFAATVIAILAVAVPLDLWGRQVHGSSRVVIPPLYTELKREAPGIVAVYPITGVTDNVAAFYRPAHDKPVYNNFRAGTQWDPVKGELQALGDPEVVPRLATLGVKYVLVRRIYEINDLKPWQPRPAQNFDGLQVIHRTPDATTYRVVAEPAPAIFVSFGSGFDFAERTGDRFTRWVVDPVSQIRVQGDDCDPCVGRLRLTVSSFAQPRDLQIRDEKGALLKRTVVGIEPMTVSVPVHVDGRATFTLSTNPGVQSIDEATGNGDPRIVSLQIAAPIDFVREAS